MQACTSASAVPGLEPKHSPAPLTGVDLLVLLLDPAGCVALLDGLLKVALDGRQEVTVLGPADGEQSRTQVYRR